MPEEHVIAVLFTDLVDSTGQLERLGDETAHQASRRHFSFLRSAISHHGGREVKTLGDGVMAEFQSLVASVRCAVDLQRHALDNDLAGSLRIGIEAGEPIREEEDLFGTAVVVAKRLCDMAEGGQILTSEVVARLAGPRIDAPFEPLGPVHLKGLSANVAACAVAWDGTTRATSAVTEPARSVITVVIADDQRMVRGGLRVILDSEPDISVLAEASDGLEAIELVKAHSPTVALLDIRMPNMNGLVAAREIIENHPGTRVLILTTFDADEYVFEALRVGASGFLLKDSPPTQLVSAIRSIAEGDALIDPSVTRRLITRFTRAAQPSQTVPEALQNLTPRELGVLKLVARGLSNQEIAVDLVVEESTVKTHVSRILMKLGLRDRVQAVVLAYESGLVTANTV